jgi:hypothetical protein
LVQINMFVKGRLLVVPVSVPMEFFPVYSDDMFYTKIWLLRNCRAFCSLEVSSVSLQIPAGIIRELKKKESDTFTNRMLLNMTIVKVGVRVKFLQTSSTLGSKKHGTCQWVCETCKLCVLGCKKHGTFSRNSTVKVFHFRSQICSPVGYIYVTSTSSALAKSSFFCGNPHFVILLLHMK